MSKYEEVMNKLESSFLRGVLIETGGNICKASREYGLHRNTLTRKIAHFGVNVDECKRIAEQQARG